MGGEKAQTALDGQGASPGRDKNVSLLHSIQTVTEAQSAPYQMGTGGLCLRV
jgi:hypothetical protein